MPHKRSKFNAMCNSVRGFITSNAFVDYSKGESVNTLIESDIIRYLYGKYGYVDYRVVYRFTRGEVLSDSRGQGTMQRVDLDEA